MGSTKVKPVKSSPKPENKKRKQRGAKEEKLSVYRTKVQDKISKLKI